MFSILGEAKRGDKIQVVGTTKSMFIIKERQWWHDVLRTRRLDTALQMQPWRAGWDELKIQLNLWEWGLQTRIHLVYFELIKILFVP